MIPAILAFLGLGFLIGQKKASASVKLDSNTEKYRDGFAKILDNAEKTAAVVQEKGKV